MATPTVPVTVTMSDPAPVSGAKITATLDRAEFYNGIIVTKSITAITDVNGIAVLNLFPNLLGSQGSSYVFKIAVPAGKTLTLIGSVPNAACDLFAIANTPAYPGKPDGQIAMESALLSQNAAATSATSAATSATSAATSATSAATSATSAATSATSAATSAASAASVLTGIYANATGTADAVTATYPSAPSVLTNGYSVMVGVAIPNATATPTFSPTLSGVAQIARVIVKEVGNAGVALAPGDMQGIVHLVYDLPNTRWVLQDPAFAQLAGSSAQVFNVAAGTLPSHAVRYDQVGLLNAANTWTAAQTFSGGSVGLTGTNAIYTATGTTGWSGFSATKTVGQVALGIDDGVTFGRANGTAILRYGAGLSLVVQDSANSSPVTFSSTGVSVTGTVNASANAINVYAASFTNSSTAGYGVLSMLGNTPATSQYFVGYHPVYGYSFQVYCDGNVRIAAGATYGNLSDQKLKVNITDATPKLPDVMRLRVRNYSLKSNPTGARYIGWIAQEVEQVFPSLVIEQVNIDADGNEIRLKGIKESALIPILVKAIQEQQVIIDDLKTRLDKGGL